MIAFRPGETFARSPTTPDQVRKDDYMTKQELERAPREELIRYLTEWGYQCYDHETTAQLRKAALENWRTEKC